LMPGTYGRYLDLDLSSKSYTLFIVPEAWTEKLVGGRGIAVRLLYELLEAGSDPLGAANVLVFATGPFQGLRVPGAGRYVLAGKSPKTRSVSDSYVGGRFGWELGRTGFDGIIVRGASAEPVYLLVAGQEVKLLDATGLWGLAPHQVQEAIRNRHGGGFSVACIGVAGENRVSNACVVHDCMHFAGRPGFGAVLGAKKLKAIAVHGETHREVADPKRFESSLKKYSHDLLAYGFATILGRFGTPANIDTHNALGLLPTRNFAQATFDGAQRINTESLKAMFKIKKRTCPACPIACKHLITGAWKGHSLDDTYSGPEYETLASFGSLCCNDDLGSIAYMNVLCNSYGLDTIGTGVLIAALMEATEKSVLSGKDSLLWGDSAGMIAFIHKLAKREGIGEIAAQGAEALASHLGDNDVVMHSKGQELPMHEPRGKLSMALYYATSPRGGTHLEGTVLDNEPACPELGLNAESEPRSWENKPAIALTWQHARSFANCLVLCEFCSVSARGEEDPCLFLGLGDLLSAALGKQVTPDDLMAVGERSYAFLRLLAEREGFHRVHDRLHRRFTSPLPNGPTAGLRVAPAELERAIDELWHLGGYVTYGPSQYKLRQLGLEEILEFRDRNRMFLAKTPFDDVP
jgi:aldehyde:ferredoxin oxidoreductase